MRVSCNKLLWVAVLLFVGTALNAAPTVEHPAEPLAVQVAACSCSQVSSSVDYVPTVAEPAIAEIGRVLFQPPAVGSYADDSAAEATGLTSLPAVPAALFMALAGSLAVVAVKDRRLWRAAFATALALSCSGVRRLPQLSAGLLRHAGAACPTLTVWGEYQNDECWADTGRCVDRRYIGLLRRLAGSPAGHYLCDHSGLNVRDIIALASPKPVSVHAGLSLRARLNDFGDCLDGKNPGSFFMRRECAAQRACSIFLGVCLGMHRAPQHRKGCCHEN